MRHMLNNKPHEAGFPAVAEPNVKKTEESFLKQYGKSEEFCLQTIKDLLNKPRLAEAVLKRTQDRIHVEPAMKAMEKGYHVMLEKPMSINPVECFQLGECAERYGRILMICHVLRSPFFQQLKSY